MAVSPRYCQSLIGQWVEAHSAYGVHYGILHAVRPDGIVLAMPRSGAVIAVGRADDLKLNHADVGMSTDFEHVQFFRPFFNPFFFFIPFFLLFALRRRFFI